jgi:hypothetical protein
MASNPDQDMHFFFSVLMHSSVSYGLAQAATPSKALCKLSKSTEQGPAETDSSSVIQEIPRILWDQKSHCPVHKD